MTDPKLPAASAAESPKVVSAVAVRPAFHNGHRVRTNDPVTFGPGEPIPKWAKVLPSDPAARLREFQAITAKAKAAKPPLATMSEINRANADLQTAMSAPAAGAPQTSRETSEAVARLSVAAATAEPAAATPPADAGPTVEDLLA